ncbi:MAG: 16S rRNA (uracil(1498)-N(3))-methyltransferase [Prevotellaceae bacterium]|jgi:16S rRNA (uracil1498-N3)-methyltransferase|nr:16S rRNA (uracil(1498)-N(3))-methyltransferase [Prevotellaceae bacterium]
MNIFYTPDVIASNYVLNEEESAHCTRVLRLGKGHTVHLADGRGTLYTARIIAAHPKACMVEIISKEEHYKPNPYRLHMAIAPTKSIERFEWLLEKITEIGVGEITPLLCEHSERRVLKQERVEKVLVAAMKQSQKAQLPLLHEMTPALDFVKKEFSGKKLMAHCAPGEKIALPKALLGCRDALILIGPEGDFSTAEITAAIQHGFEAVNLGDTRLRVETAGIVACCQMHTQWQLRDN